MANYPQNVNGQATMANSSPVVVSSDQSAVPVSGTVTANIGSVATLATAAKQDTGNTSLSSIDGKIPASPSTSGKQDTGNTSLSSIDGKLPALGQALAAASVPVILPSATITTLTPPAAITGFATEAGHIATVDTSTAAINTVLGAKTDAKSTSTDGTSVSAISVLKQISASVQAPPSQAVTFTGSTDVATQTTLSSLNTKVATAKTFDLDSGAGTDTVQAMGIAVAASGGSAAITGDTANGLDVDVTRLPALVAGSAIVGKVGIDQTTPGTTNRVDVGTVNSVAPAFGTGARGATVQRVTIATDDSLPVTNAGTFAVQATPVTQADTFMLGGVNVKEINGVTPLMGSGIMGTGSPRVTIASDNDPLIVKQATAANLNATVSIAAAQTLATVSTVTNLSQLGGTAIAMNTGTRSAGTQRVTIATDDVVPASQSGTWTVQPGNTPNSTAWLVSDQPATSGGLTTFHLVGAATDNATNVKASAGQVYSITAFNLNAAPRYLKFHNTAGTPTSGAGVVRTVLIPGNTAGAGAVINIDKGLAFSTGIGITIVTGIADSNTTAISASEVVVDIGYK